MRRIATAAAAVACIGVLGACTPDEVQRWQAWHDQDPVAAEAFIAAQPADAAPASQPDGVWDELAACESGGNWAINSGNGYYGGLQFSGSTWLAYGGGQVAPRADLASRDAQITIAARVRADVGYSAWPACARRLGLG